MLTRLATLLLAMLMSAASASADSSSPLLAAYYDRQMAIVGQVAYGWQDTDRPPRIYDDVVQVGVSRTNYYVLRTGGALLKFNDTSPKSRRVADSVARFAAGPTGVLAILKTGAMWWFARDGGKRKIADAVATAAVGDSANYYVSETGALFVKGLAHRGQYGDGRLMEGEAGRPENYGLHIGRDSAELFSPRHRDPWDQIRYCIAGSVPIGPGKTVDAGEIGYFPEGLHYGAQEGPERTVMVLQFDGATGKGYLNRDTVNRAYDELGEFGRFEKGVFRRNDEKRGAGKRNLDGCEAVWQHVTGRTLEFPPPRYTDPVIMKLAHFA